MFRAFSKSQKGFNNELISLRIHYHVFFCCWLHSHRGESQRKNIKERVKEKKTRPFSSCTRGLYLFQKRSVIQLTFRCLCLQGKEGRHSQKCLSSHHGLTEQCSVSLPHNCLIKVQLQTSYMTSNVFH